MEEKYWGIRKLYKVNQNCSQILDHCERYLKILFLNVLLLRRVHRMRSNHPSEAEKKILGLTILIFANVFCYQDFHLRDWSPLFRENGLFLF